MLYKGIFSYSEKLETQKGNIWQNHKIELSKEAVIIFLLQRFTYSLRLLLHIVTVKSAKMIQLSE